MAKTSSLVGIGIILLILFLVVFLLYKKPSGSGLFIGATSTQQSGGGTPNQNQQSGGGSSTPIPPSMNVTLVDRTSLFLQSDTFTSENGYFIFKMYRDEALTKDYGGTFKMYLPFGVIIPQEELRSLGYLWTNINPPFDNNTQYWIDFRKSDRYGIRVSDRLGKLTFTTKTFTNPELPQNQIDKISSAMKDLAIFLKENIVGLIGGEALAKILKTMFNPKKELAEAKEFIEYISSKMRSINIKSKIPELKISRVNYLSKVSLRFQVVKNIFSLTVDDLVRLGMYLPSTIKRISTKLPEYVTKAWERAILNFKNMNVAALQTAAVNAVDNMLMSTARGALNVGKAISNPVDVALLAVSIAGMIMDSENTGGLQDWDKFKTSDFLEMKRILVEAQITTLRKTGVQIPAIKGPFFEYSNSELEEKIDYIESLLLFFPFYDSTVYKNINEFKSDLSKYPIILKYYKALTRSGFIDESEVQYVEGLEVMRDLRDLQKQFFELYKKKILNVDLNIATDWEQYNIEPQFIGLVYDTALKTLAADKLHKIACYLFCKGEGGVPLIDGQCSYKNATKCLTSYIWPINTRSFDAAYVAGISPPPSPVCAQSPCLDNFDDIGKTDVVYSEWRKPSVINADYGGSPVPDYSRDVGEDGGVCVVVPYGTRTSCEASTRKGAKNSYNVYTGECTNTKAYCDAFGVDYKVVDGRITCYRSEVDEAFGMILGGNSIVQGLRIFGKIFMNGLQTMFGIGSDWKANAARRERERIAKEQKIQFLLTDSFQFTLFEKFFGSELLYSDNLSVVDFKTDITGNLYVMYAYGVFDGSLQLVKYDQFFNPDTEWLKGNNMFAFKGSIEKVISSTLAFSENDPEPTFFLLEWVENKNTDNFEQQITKRSASDGSPFSNWSISPNSLTETGNLLGGREISGAEFNGIYVYNNTLRVLYVGFDVATSTNLSFYLDYDISPGVNSPGVPKADKSYYTKMGTLDHQKIITAGEEFFSFCFHPNISGNFNTAWANSDTFGTGRGVITGGPVTVYCPDDFYTYNTNVPFCPGGRTNSYDKKYSICNILAFPSIGLNRYGELYISNGFKVWRADPLYEFDPSTGKTRITSFPNISAVINFQDYDFFPKNIPNLISYNKGTFTKDSIGTTQTNLAPWEVSLMSIDRNNNLCFILQRNIFVSFNLQSGNIVYNQLKPDLPMSFPKNINFDNVLIGIDYIQFNNCSFQKCLGHESFEILVTPQPRTNGSELPSYNIAKMNEIIKANDGNLIFPPESSSYIFSFGTTYTFEIKINRKTIKTITVPFTDSNNLYFEGGDYVVQSTSDSTCYNLTFSSKPRVVGTRTLKYKFYYNFAGKEFPVTSYGGEGEIKTSENTIRIPFITGQTKVYNYKLRMYFEGFLNDKYKDVTFSRFPVNSC